MKFLHLSDLHIGKKVNDFDMSKEQIYVLNQAIDLIQTEKIDFVVLAGDIFDRTIPSASSLEIFNDFLSQLNSLNKPVYIISGNHDSVDRLSFLSDFLNKSDIFISHSFDGVIESYDFKDLKIYLMPYLHPAIIRKYYPDFQISNYNEAFKLVLDDIKLDESKINIILSHQFVIGCDDLIYSDSEEKSVGTIESIDYHLFEKFDYCALGHLHCPQKVVLDKIRYGGSILKYSFSEINQKKYFTVVDIDKNNLKIDKKEIKFLHEFKEYKGYIDDFLKEDFYKKVNADDYIHFILLDESVIDAKKKLQVIYPNIMLLEFDNEFTRNLNSAFKSNVSNNKTLYEHFWDFYKVQTGSELDEEDKKILYQVLDEMKGCE